MSPAPGGSGSRHPQPTPRIGASTWVGLALLVVLGVFLAVPSTPTSVRIASLAAAALLARRVSIDIRQVREDRADLARRPAPRSTPRGGGGTGRQGPKGRRR